MSRTVLRHVVALGWLTLVWVMLWGTWSLANVMSGLVVAVVITTAFALPTVRFRIEFRPIGMVKWLGGVLVDLVKASFIVGLQGLKLRVPQQSSVIAVHLESKSDLAHALIIESVSIVPGSLVIEFERSERVLYAHVWSTSTEEDAEKAREHIRLLERRVVGAIGDRRVM